MKRYRYAVVGGGMAAAAAIQGIRSMDQSNRIALFSAERFPPYGRPPLSKGLWKGKRLETIWRYRDPKALAIDEYLTTTVRSLDPEAHTLEDEAGQSYQYDRLLIATGGEPNRLPGDPPGVVYFRSLDDYLAVYRAAQEKERFLVVGGGFIGGEIAAALRQAGKVVQMVFPEAGVLGGILPADLASFVTSYYGEKGVEVLSGKSVESISWGDSGYDVRTSGGKEISVDLVVAGLGIRPRVALAEAAGLTLEGGGIAVDGYGRTSARDVYAAGDVASFFAPEIGRTLRIEHEDNAVSRGRAAGVNMAGGDHEETALPYFYSDLFDLGFEAAGILDARLDTFEDWKEPNREGVVYYLVERKVVGVLNWNVWDEVDAARQIIGQEVADPKELRGRIPGS